MWQLVRCDYRQGDLLQDWMKQGFEPFAVSQDAYHNVIWLKKEIADEILLQHAHSGKRRSGKTTDTAKE